MSLIEFSLNKKENINNIKKKEILDLEKYFYSLLSQKEQKEECIKNDILILLNQKPNLFYEFVRYLSLEIKDFKSEEEIVEKVYNKLDSNFNQNINNSCLNNK